MAEDGLVKTLKKVKEGDYITVTTVDDMKLSGEVDHTMEQPLCCKFKADDKTKERVNPDMQRIDLVKQVDGGPVVIASEDVSDPPVGRRGPDSRDNNNDVGDVEAERT